MSARRVLALSPVAGVCCRRFAGSLGGDLEYKESAQRISFMEFLLPLLGGAFGAAVINGILALYKLGKDKSDEHWQWLRNQRLDAYVRFLETTDKLQRTFHELKHQRKTPEDIYTLIEEMSVQRIQLLGSSATTSACERVGDTMIAFAKIFDPIPPELDKVPAAEKANSAAITALRAAMICDLGLDKHIKSGEGGI